MNAVKLKKIFTVLLAAVIVFLSGCSLLDGNKYKNAQKLFEEEKYTEAKSVFSEITEYEDTQKYLTYIAGTE